jgi:pyruvate kinase
VTARRAKIVATLGPASRSLEMITELARAGADVFRFNFSHGTHADHKETMEMVRKVAHRLRRPLAVLADLQGPKFRIGQVKQGGVLLKRGERIVLDMHKSPGDWTRLPLPHKIVFDALKVGDLILIDDGKVRLRVESVGEAIATCIIEQSGMVSDRKGVNLPGTQLALSPLTPKDRKDLVAALDLGVDFVALSFVQKAADMAELRKLVGGRARVLAKIEKPQALDNLDEILDLCDAVMVARGDLGVELAPEEVPIAQKSIVRAARARGIPVIVATQMLDSMMVNATPTRAEASDVAHAAYEGADALMLSGETAAGSYPAESVAMMDRIIRRIESDPRWPEFVTIEGQGREDRDSDPIALAAKVAADASRACALIAYTATGSTPMRLARERPLQQLVALTPNPAVARRLALVWGIMSRIAPDPTGIEDMVQHASSAASNLKLGKKGDRLVVVAGVPFGTPGSTNLIRMARIGG